MNIRATGNLPVNSPAFGLGIQAKNNTFSYYQAKAIKEEFGDNDFKKPYIFDDLNGRVISIFEENDKKVINFLKGIGVKIGKIDIPVKDALDQYCKAEYPYIDDGLLKKYSKSLFSQFQILKRLEEMKLEESKPGKQSDKIDFNPPI